MRVFGTFMTILILGFLGVNVSQGNLGAEFYRIASEKCVANAGPDLRDLFVNSLAFSHLTCVRSSDGKMIQVSEPHAVFQFYCSKIPTVKKCTRYATSFIRPCLVLEEQEIPDIIYNITISLMDFYCQQEELFIPALSNRDECLISNAQALQKCFDEVFGSSASNASSVTDPGVAGLSARLEKPWILGIDDCRNVKKFQNCTVEVLRGCENRTVANLTESVINSFVDALPCEKFLKAHAAPSTELISSPVEQLESLMRKKCEKNGNSTSSGTAIDGLRSFSNCLTKFVNATQFKAEVISAAALPGELDTLFEEYSRKVPIFRQCVEHLTDSIEPCLVPEERETVNIISDITSSWLQNIFHEQGDRNATQNSTVV